MMRLTRRTVLTWGPSAVMLARCARGLELKLGTGASYDEVLDALYVTDMELGSALSNHAPMAAEALVAAGFPERVAPFIELYSRRYELLTLKEEPALSATERASAFGVYDKRQEWAATFEVDLQSQTPRQVLAAQWPALVSNFSALHGTLRTAHALRALEREDTPSRRRELARGLAYWSARRGSLPGQPGSTPKTGLGIAAAMAQVPLVPENKRVNSGNITQRLAPLQNNADFADAVGALDLTAAPVDDAIAELARLACRIFVNEGRRNIALLHGITGTLALRTFAPFLDTTQLQAGLAYAFQNVAAFYAIQGSSNGLAALDAGAATAEALLAKAATSTSSDPEHDIKLTEAVVREYRLTGNGELLRAAEVLLA